MKTKKYFPMFVNLEDKQIVVAGGGNIATRRVRTLLNFTRNIRVVAPEVTAELSELAKVGHIIWIQREVKRIDFQDAYMVIAATSDGRINDDIYRICKEEGIYVNIASDREKCDFHFPGIVRFEEITIGINASGVNHKKAKEVREKTEKVLADSKEEKDE